MILTKKCLSDFNQWLYENYPNDLISENCGYSYGMFERDLEQLTYILPELMLNALIIEWFDFKGIYINALKYGDKWKFIVRFQFIKSFKTRNEAISAAIFEANLDYNKNNV